jgi:hypothetical protein
MYSALPTLPFYIRLNLDTIRCPKIHELDARHFPTSMIDTLRSVPVFNPTDSFYISGSGNSLATSSLARRRCVKHIAL